MQKWEYCRFAMEQVATADYQRIIYFFDNKIAKGLRKEVIHRGYDRDDVVTLAADAPVIARLGQEGWELIDPQTLFFKRPLSSK